jgi:hypothetical protein
MSYFMFGTVTVKWDWALEKAQQSGIYLRTDFASIIHDMLRATGRGGQNIKPFLIVGSLEEDTSDSLVSPFCEPLETICSNLARIQQWALQVMSQSDTDLKIYVTEGYDDHFRELAVPAQELQETLCTILRTESDWPSLIIDVTGK